MSTVATETIRIAGTDLGFGWGEVVGGVVAGFIASGIAWACTSLWRRKRNRDHFGVLAGEYTVTEKQPTVEPAGVVEVVGSGPLLRFVWTTEDGSKATGTIAMNEQSRLTGTGSYSHTRGPNFGWGYIAVQVASRERGSARLLVDGSFTDQQQRCEIKTAWLWEQS